QAEDGILEVVVVEIFYLAPEPYRLLGTPDTIRVKAEAVARQRLSERSITLELVTRTENAAFELVRGEPVFRLERLRLGDELLAGADLPGAIVAVGVAKKEVRREWNEVAASPAEDVGDGDTPFLSEEIEARKLQRGEDLRAIVIERRGWVRDEKSHLFEPRGIAPEQI